MHEPEQQRIFDEWFSTHQGLLIKVVRAYAASAHDREDLLQEIAFQVWNSIPAFRHDSAVTTWIYRVALYCGIAWSRKEGRLRERRRPLVPEHSPILQPIEADPRVDWLYEQIARLDPVDRSLILLLLDGFSYREMAATLGISESHVGVKINRIKKTLAGRTKARSLDGL